MNKTPPKEIVRGSCDAYVYNTGLISYMHDLAYRIYHDYGPIRMVAKSTETVLYGITGEVRAALSNINNNLCVSQTSILFLGGSFKNPSHRDFR